MEFRSIITNQLLLRKVEQTDAPFVLEGLSNDVLTKYMLIQYYSLEEVQKQMDYYANHYTNKTGFYWLIETLDTGKNVGVIGVNNISSTHQKAEIGFWILPKYWQQGYTAEAAKAVLQFAFNELQLNRIEATVETENIASIATINKLGFKHEGTFEQYEINNGSFIDLMMFAILKKITTKIYSCFTNTAWLFCVSFTKPIL
jgi:ribosomal-protein-alanine N-acetyltransferase